VKILALDTATEACSAALLQGDVLAMRYEELGRGHAARILPMIDELLAAGGLTLHDLDVLGFGRGPGAFTGVRLATSVAQGLAYGAARPVVAVSDLQAIAEHALSLDATASEVRVASDARMHEVYWALYERLDAAEHGAAARLVGEERVSRPELVIERLRQGRVPAAGARIGAGRGFGIYPQLLQAAHLCASSAPSLSDLLPRAAEIARITGREFRAGRAVAAHEALPVYLRDDVAKPVSQS
jgi:tRNA threonylcarbamoyladenosine biosynthesis protein TsaB